MRVLVGCSCCRPRSSGNTGKSRNQLAGEVRKRNGAG